MPACSEKMGDVSGPWNFSVVIVGGGGIRALKCNVKKKIKIK